MRTLITTFALLAIAGGPVFAETSPPGDDTGAAPRLAQASGSAYPYPIQPYTPQVSTPPVAQPRPYAYPPRTYAPAPTYVRPAPVQSAPRKASIDPYYEGGVRGYIGASGLGTFMLGQSGGVESIDHGGGFNVFGGLDFGRVVGLELSYAGSFHNPTLGCTGTGFMAMCDTNYLVLDLLTVSLRLRIPTGTPVQPYVQGGGSVAWVGRQGLAADATGGGFEAGGGIDLWLGNHFSMGPRVLYRGIRMVDYATYTGADTFLSLITADFNFAIRF